MQYLSLIIGILEEVFSVAGTATSGQVQSIINIIDKALPFVEELGEDLATPLQNIIAALSSNGSITAAQLQTLTAQSAQIDAALDAAAAADGLTGVPGATGATGA